MNVTLEQAYEEACRALGEAIVRERFLSRSQPQSATEDSMPTNE